jgi:hypothetical protein
MEPKVTKLLGKVGLARLQAITSAMRGTGSKAIGPQMALYGAHIPNYVDPPSTIIDKSQNIIDTNNRMLFQAGRFDMIPKDEFDGTYKNYIADKGYNEQQSAPTSAPASAPATPAAPQGMISIPDNQLP